MKKSALLTTCAVFFLSLLTAQTTLTLSVLKDAAIGYHDGAGTAGNNYGSALQNAAFCIPATASLGGLNVNRALIDFDLSLIPPGSTIMSAFLNLYSLNPLGIYPGHMGPANSSYLERITQSWQEFVVTWNNQPPSTPLNQVTLANSTSATQNYLNINVTTLVIDMQNNPSTSFGFKLRMVNEASSNILSFVSNDHSNSALRPTLVVTYSSCVSPTLSSVAIPTICSGQQANLLAAGSGTNVVWFSSSTSSNPIATGTLFTTPALNAPISSPTIYTYYAGVMGCGSTFYVPAPVYVNPLPVVVASAATPSICSGQNATLSASGANSYTWLLNQNTVALTPTLLVSPVSNTTYSAIGTNSNGCVGMSSFTIIVHPLPSVTAFASTLTVCSGQNVTLTATGVNSYAWLVNQNTLALTPTVAVNPSSTITYSVKGTDANGCSGTSTLSITVNPSPVISVTAGKSTICIGQKVALNAGGAASYTWFVSQGTVSSSSPTVFVSPSTSVTYSVLGSNSSGCVGSATVNVIVNECTALADQSTADFYFSLYPNPCEKTLVIRRSFASVSGDFYEIRDLQGKTVLSQKLSDNFEPLDFIRLELEPGMYFCSYISEGRQLYSGKFLVNR